MRVRATVGALGDGMAETSFKYRAFISYSHADHEWAVWLHRALERYRVPKKIAGAKGVTRLGKCFRDEEELSAAAELGPEIAEALMASDTLIVVCSPRAAQSPWVDKEIAQFKQLARAAGPKAEDRVFALIVDGEPHGAGETECFPPALKLKTDGSAAEPLAVDVRKFGRDDALLRLVGGILDVGYDDLRQREARKRRAEMFRAQALFVSGLALTGAALAGGFFAASNYVDANEQKSALFAAAADQLSAEDNHLPAMLMALHGDPAAEAGVVEGLFRRDGYASRDALVRAYTHRRLAGFFGDEGVSVMAVGPADGGIIALGHRDGSVSVWSARGEKLRALAEAGTPEVKAVGISGDQRVVAAGDADGRMRVWAVADGREMAAFAIGERNQADGMARAVTGVALSPDGTQVATIGFSQEGGEVKLWSAEGGGLLHALRGSGGYVQEAMFTRDGRRLVAATGRELIEAWRTDTGEKIEPGVVFNASITAFTLADDDRVIVAGSEFGDIFTRALGEEDGLSTRPYRYSVESVDVSSLNNFVLTTDSSGYARVHQDPLNEEVRALAGEMAEARFIDGGRRVLTTNPSGRVELWEIYRGKKTWEVETPALEQVAVSADGSLFAVLGPSGVKAWSVKTGKLVLNETVGSEYADLRVSADGAEVVVIAVDGAVWRWRIGAPVLTAKVPAEGGIVPDPSGANVLKGFGGGDVIVWSLAENRAIQTFHREGVRAAGGVFATKAPLVLVGYSDGSNLLWSTETGEQVSSFAANLFSEEVTLASVVKLSPDGSIVAQGVVDGTIVIYDTATGRHLVTLTGHSTHIEGLSFSPDGKLLASASGDGSVKLWSVHGALALETFEPHDRDVMDIAFMPDGRRVLVGSLNATALWEIDPIVFASARAQVDMACAKLTALDHTEFEIEELEQFPIVGRLGANACRAEGRWGAANQGLGG